MDKNIEKRQMIIESAMRELVKNDIQGTSMSKISKTSNIPVGSLYLYFDSKADLVTEIYRYCLLVLMDELVKLDVSVLNENTFHTIVNTLLNFLTENPLILEFVERYSNSPIINGEVKSELYQEYETLFSKLIDSLSIRENAKLNISESLLIEYLKGAILMPIRASIITGNNYSTDQWESYFGYLWSNIVSQILDVKSV